VKYTLVHAAGFGEHQCRISFKATQSKCPPSGRVLRWDASNTSDTNYRNSRVTLSLLGVKYGLFHWFISTQIGSMDSKASMAPGPIVFHCLQGVPLPAQ
jgi:hypothetical protein